MKKVLLIIALISNVIVFAGEKNTTTAEYIAYWKVTAVEQMNVHGIPASITLAQGILESANGNSRLAKGANNHFGIKCKKEWSGPVFIHDDDQKDECFRSYESASKSYQDHSLFLTSRERYSKLFDLKATDYKAWAKGLKSAGYATNPKYAELLIDLIERNNLSQFDLMPDFPEYYEQGNLTTSMNTPIANLEIEKGKSVKSNYKFEKSVDHLVFEHKNEVKYIVVKKGDTFYQLAKEFEMGIWQLYKYNDLGKRDVLKQGEFIYLVPKKNKGKKAYCRLETEKQLTYRELSQLEGIKLSKLLTLNGSLNPDEILPIGTKIILR